MFVEYACQGYSIHVEACIGSGKTTAIQMLCGCLPSGKRILYLTYNSLLKQDAKARITGPNVEVTNYHGFAYGELMRNGVFSTQQDCVLTYNRLKPAVRHYDVLMIDEYQDISQEIAELLMHIKDSLPGLQIIMVGDMAQKIYDKTRLDVQRFVDGFMPANTLKLEFTQCFRLSPSLAAHLGHVWGKTIVGVNPDCDVYYMDFTRTLDFLKTCEPGEILCLGSNTGLRVTMLNRLEADCPQTFNKNTCWSKMSNRDGGATHPSAGTAIFTTYDGCKGMERDICVVFDWTENYWYSRNKKPEAKYEILRNLFCVAASRGKRRIIFVTGGAGRQLPWRSLMFDPTGSTPFEDMAISTMFDFKYEEDIEAAYRALNVKTIAPAGEEISVRNADGFIDLSACIGVYQEAMFFRGYDIDEAVRFYFEENKDMDYKSKTLKDYTTWTLDQKILYLISLETNQHRYWYQVALPLVSEDGREEIRARLAGVFTGDEMVQGVCRMPFCSEHGSPLFMVGGQYDVVDGDILWELKFVSELARVHFLQCAMYMVAQNKPVGRLFNVRTGEIVELTIPDRREFMNRAARAATKSRLKSFHVAGAASMMSGVITDWVDQFDQTASVQTQPAVKPDGESVVTLVEPEKKPARRKKQQSYLFVKAKDYPRIVNQFLQEHQQVTTDVLNAVGSMRAVGKKPSAQQLEDMFSLRGAELPLPCATFALCFWEVYDVLAGGQKHEQK